MFSLALRRLELKLILLASACFVASSLLLLHSSFHTRQSFSYGRQIVPARLEFISRNFNERERDIYHGLLACVQFMKSAVRPDEIDMNKTLECVQDVLKPDENIRLEGGGGGGTVKRMTADSETLCPSADTQKGKVEHHPETTVSGKVESNSLSLEGEDPRSQFLKWPVINPFNYNFTINRRLECVKFKTEILLVVPSAPSNFERRSIVRQSQAWKYAKTSRKISLLFFIGKPRDDTNRIIQQQIDHEARIHNDIIQVNFFDLYENIRLKAMSMLKWAIMWCPKATYVIRTDDDVKVNLTDLIDAMRNAHKNYTDFVIGKRMIADVPARTNKKYHLSFAEYPHPTFPPYVLGGLIGYPLSTVQLLYEAALRLKPIWLDDVFITGMCAAQMGIPVLEDPKFQFEHLGKTKPIEETTTKNSAAKEGETKQEKKEEKKGEKNKESTQDKEGEKNKRKIEEKKVGRTIEKSVDKKRRYNIAKDRG